MSKPRQEPAGADAAGEMKSSGLREDTRRIGSGVLLFKGRSPSPTLVLAWLVVSLAVMFAVAPSWFTGFDPLVGVPADRLQAPSWDHPFGTDQLGRDMLARVIHGAAHSLSGAFLAVSIGITGGVLMGTVAGSAGRVMDAFLMRLVDVLLSIPGLLLMLTVIILTGAGTQNAALAVGITAIAGFARLMRAEVGRVRRAEYVEAAFASGGPFVSVLFRHVIPNALGPVLALAAIQFGGAILAIATLGFLGYGTPPPAPEWGLLIAEGRDYMATSWWMTTLPGLVVVAVVLAANRIGQSIGMEK